MPRSKLTQWLFDPFGREAEMGRLRMWLHAIAEVDPKKINRDPETLKTMARQALRGVAAPGPHKIWRIDQ